MKRLRFLSVLICVIIAQMIPTKAMTDDYELGDLNHDGSVDVADVVSLINRVLSGHWSSEQETQTISVNGVSFTMVAVEGGTFTMGATPEQGSNVYDNEKPAHLVTLSSFSICQTEVTQALWLAVMGTNPSYFSPRNGYEENLQSPVEWITWYDCQTFISKLNEITGKQFRLPTEAEWEFAARGGNLSQSYKYAGGNILDEVAWCSENNTRPHTVATKVPNELGLYDMSGNVSEWCQDWYGYYSGEDQTNPTGANTGSQHVIRGGGWVDVLHRDICRVSYRGYNGSTLVNSLGLRLAL